MSQKPIKKIKILEKPTKYQKKSKKKNDYDSLVTKEINKSIVEKYKKEHGQKQ